MPVKNYKPTTSSRRKMSTLVNTDITKTTPEKNLVVTVKKNMKDEYTDNLRYVACKIRDEFNSTGYTNETITDMLVEYLYGRDKRYKQLLWFCYGQYIYNNLKKNIGEKKTKFVQCVDCDEWVEVDVLNTKTCRCDRCQHEETKRIKREYKRQKSQR